MCRTPPGRSHDSERRPHPSPAGARNHLPAHPVQEAHQRPPRPNRTWPRTGPAQHSQPGHAAGGPPRSARTARGPARRASPRWVPRCGRDPARRPRPLPRESDEAGRGGDGSVAHRSADGRGPRLSVRRASPQGRRTGPAECAPPPRPARPVRRAGQGGAGRARRGSRGAKPPREGRWQGACALLCAPHTPCAPSGARARRVAPGLAFPQNPRREVVLERTRDLTHDLPRASTEPSM